jgi:hypothetical protein
LQGQQRVVVGEELNVDLVTLFLELIQLRHDVGVVLIEAASIDDDVDVITLISDDSVVDNTAALGGKHGQGSSTNGQVGNIRNSQTFNELVTVLAGDSIILLLNKDLI